MYARFHDRTDTGRQLGIALESYRKEAPLVLAIPKGGIPVGLEVARHLGAKFSVLIARKLPFPQNPESGFGAVAEDGTLYLHEIGAHPFSKREIEDIARCQRDEINRRIDLLRQGKPLPPIEGRTVILVDDGIAIHGVDHAGKRRPVSQPERTTHCGGRSRGLPPYPLRPRAGREQCRDSRNPGIETRPALQTITGSIYPYQDSEPGSST